MRPMLKGSADGAGGGVTSGPTQRGGQRRDAGETMAVYNRLQPLGKNLSFEESVALRKGSRSQQRKLLSQIDRASAGGQDEIDDIDW